MRRTSLPLVASAAVGASLAHTTEAHALGPLSLEAGINAGYATSPDSADAINPLGVGLGGRVGVSILGFYGGVDGEYYLGGSTSTPYKRSESALEYGTLGMYFIGADANALLITGYTDANGNKSLKASFTAHGQAGVTF
jgi:hypothetical protein